MQDCMAGAAGRKTALQVRQEGRLHGRCGRKTARQVRRTSEPLPVAVTVLVEAEHALEVVLELHGTAQQGGELADSSSVGC
jgi:hypothetical protein